MKTRLLIFLSMACSSLVLAGTPPPAAAPALAPELAPLAAKHKADLAAVDQQRTTQLGPFLPAYFNRLDAEEKKALTRADIEAVAALRKERDAVQAGNLDSLVAAAFPANLPASLKPSRDTLFDTFKRIAGGTAAQRKKVDADYLIALATLQNRAAGNAALAQQIKAESDAVLGNPVTTPDGDVAVQAKAGKVINGDFSQMDGKGVPVGWKLYAHGDKELQIVPAGTTFSAVKENAHFLVRMSRTNSKGDVFLVQDVEIRRGAREVELSILYRGDKAKGAAPRVEFDLLDEQGHSTKLGSTDPADFGTAWKEFTTKIQLVKQKDAKAVRIRVGDGGSSKTSTSTGNFDFQKLEVKFK